MTVNTNSLKYVPRRSSKNCCMKFANSSRQTDRFKENYNIERNLHLFKLRQVHPDFVFILLESHSPLISEIFQCAFRFLMFVESGVPVRH